MSSRWVAVTGAGGGMGLGVVRRLLRDGYAVLAVLHGDDDPADLASGNGSPHPVRVDLAQPSAAETVREALQRAMGPGDTLHGLVNLAGISTGDAIDGIRDDDWELSLAVNVSAPMRLARALVPLIRAAGGGAIVNVASPVALLGARKVSYAASKAALLGLNVALARGLGRDQIRVNAVLPGPTITRMTADWGPEKRAAIAQQTFLGRLCTPDDIAGAVAFLLGPDSSFVTGTVLDVTGGSLLGAH